MTGRTDTAPVDRRALLQLSAGALLISFAAVFVRLLTVPPTTSAFYRTLTGGLVLGAFLLLRGKAVRISARAVLVLVVAGLLFALDLAFWHRSIYYVGPGLATLLANFQVFVLAIAGVVVFRERLTPVLAIGILLALAGLTMIVGPDWQALSGTYRAGVGLGLLTAVCYGAYVLALRRARLEIGDARHPAMLDVTVASLASAAFLGIFALANRESLVVPDLREGGLLVTYALVTQVFGWVLISSSLARLPASRVGLVLLVQPTFAYVWDVLFFHKPVGLLEGGGAALALAAIYLGSRARPG